MNNQSEDVLSLLGTTTLLWLDRDGVINSLVPTPALPGQAGYGPRQVSEVSSVYPGAVALIKAATIRKIPIVIGSNQGPLHARWDFPAEPINPYQDVTLRLHPPIYERFLRLMEERHIPIASLPSEAPRYSDWSALSWSDHQAIHARIMQLLQEQGIDTDPLCALYCPHATKTNCHCRKPKIGLFRQAECLLSLGEAQKRLVLVVGDSVGDWEFAQGLLTMGIRTRFSLPNTGNYQVTQQHLETKGYHPSLFLNQGM